MLDQIEASTLDDLPQAELTSNHSGFVIGGWEKTKILS